MIKKINVKMRLMSPLAHFGDERMGTMQTMRTHKFIVDGKAVDCPVFSGNAFRGILRRIMMDDFLEKIGIKVKELTEDRYEYFLNGSISDEEGITKKLFHCLYTGGALTSGSRYEEIGERQRMSALCPPLSILGTALGDRIPQGKFASDIFKPICKELVNYTGIESDISFYDLLEEVFYTRKDDLKSVLANIKAEESKKKKENATQMKYEMQCLAAGTVLTGDVSLEMYTDVELSCLQNALNKFAERGVIGGKGSAGHGKVSLEIEQFADAKVYEKYIEDNKEQILAYIRELEEILS